MTYDKIARQRERRREKREAQYKDLRLKANKSNIVHPRPNRKPKLYYDKNGPLTPPFYIWANHYDNYIHHCSRHEWDYDIKCECGPKDATTIDNLHYHYLREPDEKEKRLAKTGHLHRLGRSSKDRKDYRVKIKCVHHMISVIHYLRCKKTSQNKDHSHREFQTFYNLPICTGCVTYKAWLREKMNVSSNIKDCKNCMNNMRLFKQRYARKIRNKRLK